MRALMSAAAVFALAVGGTVVGAVPAHAATGEVVVFQVVDTTAPTEPLDAATRSSLDTETRAGLYSEFVAALRDDAGLRINQQVLNQLLVQNYGQ